jgi:hypothetical protein
VTRTVFDRPQFSLRSDRAGIRNYANVSNLLEVADAGLRVHYVAVEVPATLFTLMRRVFNVPPTDVACLALDELTSGRWRYVLSLRYGADQLVDLWGYTAADYPKWMFMREYRVQPTAEQLEVLLG